MKYRVNHTTTYDYASVVNQSHHVLHLSPRETTRQAVSHHRLVTYPASEGRVEQTDYFGNRFSILNIEMDHDRLVVEAHSDIEVKPYEPGELAQSCDWRALAGGDVWATTTESVSVAQFTASSRHGKRLQAAADYARQSFPSGCPILVGTQDLTRRIYEDFTFDPAATDISTPVETVLDIRRGVCQDFAHLQISALRSLGLPARYVSGYIRTHPPEGQPRLQGADASHAWLSVWAPEFGWVDFDPTNNVIPRDEHIIVAYGRDYDDVCPISGVLLGGGDHTVTVAVDVMPLEGAR